MSEFLDSLGLIDEAGMLDRSDEIYAHPLVREMWPPLLGGDDFPYLDPTVPKAEKIEARQRMAESLNALFYGDEAAAPEDPLWKKLMVERGCPEEPDAPSQEVSIRYPKDWDGETTLPVVFSINGGALLMCFTDLYKGYNEPIADELGAAVVVPIYRTAIDAEYPAAINDLHAAYVWVIEHADEMRFDPDNITLYGSSSGAHLALSLAFRLKRYGFSPRGAVASLPITDDRLTKASSRTYVCESEWSGTKIFQTAQLWLGKNAGSPFLGPEAFPNRATVEDCRGLCPIFIDTFELDPDVSYSLEFVGKLLEAGVFFDYHISGGCSHGMGGFAAADEGVQEYMDKNTRQLMDDLSQCMRFDLRRPA